MISPEQERLPSHVITITPVQIVYNLQQYGDYYDLTLKTSCQLTLCCQRCMESFEYSYQNRTQIGLCDSDEVAERIMDQYEPVVLEMDEIPFETIIIDELHLYLPLFHSDEKRCLTVMNAI
jgi:uncharacterized protein